MISIDVANYRIVIDVKKSNFVEHVTIESSQSPHIKKIIYKRDLDIDRLGSETLNSIQREKRKIRDVAYRLRKTIMWMFSKKPFENITIDDLIVGECDIPTNLFQFMCLNLQCLENVECSMNYQVKSHLIIKKNQTLWL